MKYPKPASSPHVVSLSNKEKQRIRTAPVLRTIVLQACPLQKLPQRRREYAEESRRKQRRQTRRSCLEVLRATDVQPASLAGSTNPLVSEATPAGKIATLRTIEPGGLNAVAEDEWVESDVAVDSGATEKVIPEDALLHVDLKGGEAYKRGVTYEVANGVKICNQGERRFTGITEEGLARSLTAQVCEANQGLLSVKE